MFSDATLYPVSLAQAWWLLEEKNSLKDWLPEKADAQAKTEENVWRIIAEKDEALATLVALRGGLADPPVGHCAPRRLPALRFFLAPGLVYLIVVRLVPAVTTVAMSFTHWNLQESAPPHFVGPSRWLCWRSRCFPWPIWY